MSNIKSRSYISIQGQGHLRLQYPPNTMHLQWFDRVWDAIFDQSVRCQVQVESA